MMDGQGAEREGKRPIKLSLGSFSWPSVRREEVRW